MAPRFVDRVRYQFDNVMARGTSAMIALLGLASVALIGVVVGLVMLVAADEKEVDGDPMKALWLSLLRTLDPGTMGGDDGSPQFLALMLMVTIGGIFIVSALVGVLATGLQNKLGELRKGRSRVVERGHFVILGWTDQIFSILGELAQAVDGPRLCVVILADRNRVEMEDEIRARFGSHPKIRVVCRTGDPADPTDLQIVRPDEAAVITLPSPDIDQPDVNVVKSLLALRHLNWPHGRVPVVAAVAESPNLAATRLAGDDAVTFVDAEDVTARLLVQSIRHAGLSAVCIDLLSFEGNELHTVSEPSLTGWTYGDSLLAFDNATVIGLLHPDGRVSVSPAMDTAVGEQDQFFLLATSSTAIRRAQVLPSVVDAISEPTGRIPGADRTLIVGWNRRAPTVVRLLDGYLAAGSEVTVALPYPDDTVAAMIGATTRVVANAVPCEPTRRADLEALGPGSYDRVVVLSESGRSQQDADARTLFTLLQLRDIKERAGHSYAIVAELNSEANRRLAQVTRADDFVVSNRMVGLLLTQLARNYHLEQVFSELFDPKDSNIHVKPAADYLIPSRPANFATVIEAARRQDQTAIGYRIEASAGQAPQYGIVLNPDKAAPLILGEADRVIVIARG